MSALLQRPRPQEEKAKLCDGDAGAKMRDGGVLFETFVGELDAIYAQTDEIMREADFKMSPKLKFKPKRTLKQGVEISHSADATVIPFGFDQTSHAVSVLMLTDPNASRCNEKLQDTVTVNYQVKSQLEPGESSKLAVYAAVRRYDEAGRMVFVWRALNEGQGDLCGFQTDETGWLVLRPQNVGNGPSTVLESYVRYIHMSIFETASSKAAKDQFAKVVAETGETEVNEMMQMLEKMLIGDDRVENGGSRMITDAL